MTSPASRRQQSSGSDAIERGPVVHLRRPVAGDRAEWVALRESSLDHLLPWEPRLKVRSEAERWESFFRTSDAEDRQRFLICRNEDARMVGYVGLNGIRHGVLQSCELGYWIGKSFTRNGYMTEGLLLAVRHAFEHLKLHRVEANVQPRNVASIGVVKKAGLRFEGVALRFLQIDGKWCDHQRWALTAEEWKDPFARSRSGNLPQRQKSQRRT
ncbi:MAG: GNAT family N-acetyltransferase [Phycisphaeraceae bacterium]|nr:GNAT family N-acetyltransferase [Phycisphaeraceae bacterium]